MYDLTSLTGETVWDRRKKFFSHFKCVLGIQQCVLQLKKNVLELYILFPHDSMTGKKKCPVNAWLLLFCYSSETLRTMFNCNFRKNCAKILYCKFLCLIIYSVNLTLFRLIFPINKFVTFFFLGIFLFLWRFDFRILFSYCLYSTCIEPAVHLWIHRQNKLLHHLLKHAL